MPVKLTGKEISNILKNEIITKYITSSKSSKNIKTNHPNWYNPHSQIIECVLDLKNLKLNDDDETDIINKFPVVVVKPLNTLDEMSKWCEENLTGEWRIYIIEASSYETNGTYQFIFDNESDSVIFSLAWI